MPKKIFLILLILITSCRIRNPSIQEQEQLIKDGAFPAGIPPWVVTSAHPEISRNYSGIIPNKFEGFDRQLLQGPDKDKTNEETKKEESPLPSASTPTQVNDLNVQRVGKNQANDSPIQRINDVCPGLESQVSDAVVTENSFERMIKYKQLVAKCTRSEDLWFWLGKEYLTEGNIPEAKNCFEQVLILNREHKEAGGLLNQIKGIGTVQKPINR